MIRILKERVVLWSVSFAAPVEYVVSAESLGRTHQIAFDMMFKLTDADAIVPLWDRVHSVLLGERDKNDTRLESQIMASIIFPLAKDWEGVGPKDGDGALAYTQDNLAALFRTYPSAFLACYQAYVAAYNGRVETRAGNLEPLPGEPSEVSEAAAAA